MSVIPSFKLNYDTIKKLLLNQKQGVAFLFPNFSYMKNILMCSVGSYVDIANSDDFNCLDIWAMGSLIGVLFGLYIIYLGVKHISSKVGIDFHALFGGKHFFGFIFSIFASVFKPFGYFLSSLSIPMQRLLGLTLQLPKHYEGFMPSLQKFFLLNRFHTGLLMNGKRDRISPNHSFTHSIIVANTGRGKTSSFVIPNIFTLDNCSILVTDLSGELYQKTSGKMKEKGFEIKTINLANTNKSSMFNPLASVKTDRDILEVVEILFNASNVKSSDTFWDQGARTILKLIITCLVNQRERDKTDEFCNLANVRFLLNNFGKSGKGITNFFAKYADDITLNDFNGFISGSEKTTQGLISTALSCLSIVGTETIARLTSKNEIDFSEIRNRKTIVYLIIPQQDLSAYSFILNLFYARFFKACFESKTTNTLPVYCLLDEAGHTKIPNLATVIATIRKYKVSISLIFQSLSQMTNLYGKDEAQVILGGGITSKVFYAGCDDETCDKLEKILGNITVQETDKNGRTYTKQTPLMTAQEIRMMGDNQALYLFSNKKPILMTLQPYFRSWKFNSYTKIKPYTGIDRALPSVNYVNLDCWEDMKNEQIIQQETEIINPNLVCDIHTGREIDVNNQENVPSSVGTSQEIIAQMIYDNKKKVQKIMIKPKFFKCRDYIMESTKYSVDRVLKGYSKGIKFQKGETYTQYAKRMIAKETIMN